MRRVLMFLGLLLGMGLALAEPAIVGFQVTNPRAFGYVVGDTVERQVVAEVAKPYRLREETLPRPGRFGPWLELRDMTVKRNSGFDTNRYHIGFAYQVFNSPEAVKVLSLPAVVIEFVDGDDTIAREVPSWAFTVAPVAPGKALVLEGLGEMRPDRPPQPIATMPYWMRLGLYGGAIAAILLYLTYAYVGLPFVARSNGPFARACRDLKRLARRGDAEVFKSALRRVHRAFDETAGATVFADQLARFFAQHPCYADVSAATESFFRLSRHEFFGEGAVEPRTRSVDWLLGFCRECRDRERGVA